MASSSYATPSFGLPCSSWAQWMIPAERGERRRDHVDARLVPADADPDSRAAVSLSPIA
jgi:hypothetical protein